MRLVHNLNDISNTTFDEFKKIIENINEENEEYPIELYNCNSDTLSFIVSGNFCLVRFMKASLEPPYCSASTGNRVQQLNQYFDFNVGGTLTPVPVDRAIPIELAIRIAKQFYIDGSLLHSVIWIED